MAAWQQGKVVRWQETNKNMQHDYPLPVWEYAVTQASTAYA